MVCGGAEISCKCKLMNLRGLEHMGLDDFWSQLRVRGFLAFPEAERCDWAGENGARGTPGDDRTREAAFESHR